MTTTHTLRLLTLGALAAVAALPVCAQDAGNYYGGLSLGRSRADLNEQGMSDAVIAGGTSTTGISRDRRDTAYRLFGGYQINRNFAVEAGYFDLGKFGFSSTTVPAGSLRGELKAHGVNLDLVGRMPLTDRLSAIARLGTQYAKTRDNFSGTGAVAVLNSNPSSREWNYKLGLGLQYAISTSVLVRAEVERYRIDDAVGHKGDVDVLSLSLVIPFGGNTESTTGSRLAPTRSARVVEPAPEPAPIQAQAPVRTPVPEVEPTPIVPVALPPARRRVSFSAESLFAFDDFSVTDVGKAHLDKFARELVGTQFEVIAVEGHTDRLGTTEYNQNLSVQRAEAVKNYLVNVGQVDPMKITVVGKSEAAPVTKPEDCKGTRASARLIACLQPDRRVEIEVVGMR